MIVVLDASGAAEIAAKTQAGIDLINVLLRAERVLAPELFIAEICNVMWKISRKDEALADPCMDMAGDCIDFIDEYVPASLLWKEALRLAQEHNHAVYDMLYAALARHHDATLLTMDEKLCATCKEINVRCTGGIKA